jgi:hypothetical protein
MLSQQFKQLAFPQKMTGNLLAVKQDDGNVVAISGLQLCILGNVDFLKCEVDLDAATRNHVLGAIAQMTVRLGVKGDAVHPRGVLRSFFPTREIFLLLGRKLVDLDAHCFEL